ncbi:MAG: Xaa-Pro peptidase family protein [Novibacillus thermophilus]|uniref:Xaa-Pro dipeptidase n=1 Tax=Novibacillus thermophilus TaxID=1471761 RepID=A0A1U9K983_9BACL|nr:Xaa-Pro peptidase family protein [Novibacillus thermophilus]AQS56581.1 Xaa-Pro dipeptidase [Novibacillus thermophilus]
MKRLERLRHFMHKENIDALLVSDAVNRRYVTGFTGTSGFALVTRDRALLITDFRYVTQAREQAPHFHIVQHKGTIWQTVAEQCARLEIRSLAYEEHHLTVAQFRELEQELKGTALKPSDQVVERLRQIKDERELAILQKAAEIADRTYEHILSFIREGVTERDVMFELEFVMRKLGAQSSSFDIIVASGKRSALPHGVASGKKLEQGDFVTLDFGAVYEGYCSDMTRTVVVGEPSAKQRNIYDIVLKAQERVLQGLRPGMTGREADALARHYIAERGYGDNFGHSTGHGIGLDVHEGPLLSHKSETVLQPGMVVTVEPGIYIPDLGGVRIEDDVVITGSGCKRLTRSEKELVIV